VDDPEQRTRAALQARRLLPRRGIEHVEIGGKLVARSKPIQLRAEFEKRFLEIVGAETQAEDFDVRDPIRAVDLDRSLIIFGKRRRLQSGGSTGRSWGRPLSSLTASRLGRWTTRKPRVWRESCFESEDQRVHVLGPIPAGVGQLA
jgi:hypothetical protein